MFALPSPIWHFFQEQKLRRSPLQLLLSRYLLPHHHSRIKRPPHESLFQSSIRKALTSSGTSSTETTRRLGSISTTDTTTNLANYRCNVFFSESSTNPFLPFCLTHDTASVTTGPSLEPHICSIRSCRPTQLKHPWTSTPSMGLGMTIPDLSTNVYYLQIHWVSI